MSQLIARVQRCHFRPHRVRVAVGLTRRSLVSQHKSTKIAGGGRGGRGRRRGGVWIGEGEKCDTSFRNVAPLPASGHVLHPPTRSHGIVQLTGQRHLSFNKPSSALHQLLTPAAITRVLLACAAPALPLFQILTVNPPKKNKLLISISQKYNNKLIQWLLMT